MENKNSEPTALETLFLEAGLPASEVESCPVPNCTVCRAPLPRAA